MRVRLVAAACGLLVAFVVDARAWFVTVDGINSRTSGVSSDDTLRHAIVDAAGDVFGAGTLTQLLSVPPIIDERAVVTKHAGADGTLLWKALLGVSGSFNAGIPTAVALNSAGDLVVAGRWADATGYLTFAVAKVVSATGAVAWERNIVPTPLDHAFALDVAVDANDDVVAVGGWDVGNYSDALVYKLDGATGATLWSRIVDGSASVDVDVFRKVALDAAGDVFTSGVFEEATEEQRVMKFSGATGADLWPAPVVLSFPAGIAVHPDGDLVVADLTGSTTEVVKLATADGAVTWQHTISASFSSLSATPSFDGDDPLLAGTIDARFAVVKLDGASGDEVWTFVDGAPETFALGAAAVGNGTIVAGGGITDPLTDGDFYAVRLDAATGASLAAYRADSGTARHDFAADFAMAPGGAIVLAGEAAEDGTGYPSEGSTDIALLRFDDRLGGKAIVVLDQGAASRLIVRAKDAYIFASTPGGPGDPTLDGATLVVTNPTSLETATLTLPAPLWKPSPGTKPGRVQYKYSDPTAAAGPCRAASVKAGRVLKVKCLGSLGGFTLDEASQGGLNVRLTLGTGGAPYCMAFGGVTVDVPGQFKARNAPAPMTCE